MKILLLLGVLLLSLGGAQAQTIRRITAPGKFYVDDKQSAGVIYNYAVYMISNNTASTIPSAYVALTNLIATNMISLASSETPIRALGVMAPGQTKLAAFLLKGPGFTGNSDTLLNVTNETHSVQVYNGLPGIGSLLVSSNYSFTNIIFVIEALANKITIITNLNPIAPLGSDVDLVIGGETGTIGGNNSVSFSPGVFGSWRPDAYELVNTVVRFTENPTYTNQLYFDPTISGFTNYSGQIYTNIFSFRAVKVTGTNLSVSPFLFVDSGSGTKHTAVSTLTAGGGSNLIYSAINQVAIVSQTVTPNSLNAPGGTVTYSITFSNYAATVSLSEIRDTLAGFPGNVTYIPGSATYNALPISDPSIIGQDLRWALPFTIISNSTATLTFQATVPLPAGQYTNSATAILGAEQIDTTLLTTDNSPSRSVLTVIPVSDMGVGKTAPATIFASSNFNYTIAVTNFGPSPNTSFSVTDSLPASVTFVSATPTATLSGNQVIWTNLGTLAVNASTNLTITVTAPANAAGLTNIANVGGPISDPNSTNNVTPPVITTSVTNRPPVALNDFTIATNGVAQVFNPLSNDSDPDGDAISIQSASYSGGTVSINAGATNITFTTTNNNNGAISYTIIDTRGGTSTANIFITGLNNAPVAGSQNISIIEDTSTNLVLTATDVEGSNLVYAILSGPTNGALSGFNGATGNVTYSPTNDYVGPDSFTFTAFDGSLYATGQVSITVSPINDPPVANDLTITMPEDTSTNLVLTATDVDSTNLVFAILVGPTNGNLGTLDTNTGAVTYTPVTNFAGQDGFTFTVFDGQLYATGRVLSITVNPLNDAPLANSQSVTNNEDTAFGITLTGSDVDGPVTNFVLVSLPLHGLLSGSGANLTYTPTNNYNGPDSFTFTVNDGSLTSLVATVSITVTPVNDAPVAVNDTITVNEDSTNSIPVLVNDSDPDGNPLTLVSVTSTNGTAIIVGTNVVYTPSANFFGTNVINYCVSDGVVTNCATITVTVLPVNDAPAANNLSVTINEDSSTNLVVSASDVDNTNLTFAIVSGPSNGSLGILNTNTGAVTYSPSNNFNGADSFTFRVFDGSLYATGTVSITVTPQNDAPLAFSQSVTNNEDTALPITLTGSDVDGPVTNFVVATQPTHGTLSGSGANLTYTPTNNYNGPDSFTFTVNDGSLTSLVATVSITVTPVNDPPVAVNDSATTPEDTQVSIPLLLNDSDPDGNALSIQLITFTNGLVTVNGTNLLYTPSTNFFGTNVITYTITDGVSNATALIFVIVTPLNDAPSATNDAYSTFKNVPLNVSAPGVLANDADVDSLLTALLATNVTHGTLLLNANGSFTYTPSNNYVGPDSFAYYATDGSLSNLAIVSLTISATNTAPVANDDSYSVNEDNVLNVLVTGGVLTNDTDVDLDTLTATIIATTTNGVLAPNANGSFTYTPNTNFVGVDTFTYRANDGFTNSGIATVTITVNTVNDPPAATNFSVTMPEDSSTNLVVTGSDVESTNLTFSILTGPANGSLGTLNTNSGAVTYTPANNYVGLDTFTFTVFDGVLYATGTVSITVTPVNDPPIANNDSITVNEDSTNSIPVLVNDTDPDGNPLTLVSVSTNATIVGTNIVFTPAPNFSGTNVLTYCITDGFTTNCATITVIILAINDAPVAVANNYTTSQNTPLTVAASGVLGNDTDAETNALIAVLVGNPANGTLTLLTNGGFTYTPTNNFTGTDSFTYRANDGLSDSAPVTVSILVTPLADVAVIKTGPTNVIAGASFSYIISVTNYGPSAASNVVVVDNLPTNITFVSATGGGSNIGFTATWPVLPSLAKNAGTNFTIVVLAPTNGSFINIAYATSTTDDPNLFNNNGSESASRVSTVVIPAAAFGIRAGTNVFNPQTGLYEQNVIVTNTSGSTASAIRLLVWNFTSTNGAPRTNVSLWNAHGVAGDGRSYVQYNSGVNPGSNVVFHLEYYNPSRIAFTNSLEAIVVLPEAAATNLSGGVLIDKAFQDNRPGDPRFVFEWVSIIGRNYTVIYGPSVNGPWTAATPTVNATSTRTQWYDDGPPKTASEPLAGSRFYRVILNPINN